MKHVTASRLTGKVMATCFLDCATVNLRVRGEEHLENVCTPHKPQARAHSPQQQAAGTPSAVTSQVDACSTAFLSPICVEMRVIQSKVCLISPAKTEVIGYRGPCRKIRKYCTYPHSLLSHAYCLWPQVESIFSQNVRLRKRLYICILCIYIVYIHIYILYIYI